MSNNGEDLSGRDPISSLIGSLFSAALTVAMQLRSSEEIEAEDEAQSQLKQQSPDEGNSNLVKMTRQDVERHRQRHPCSLMRNHQSNSSNKANASHK